MNLLKFWFLRTIHPTTNKKPKSKYASYIFFRKRQDVILCISVVKKVWQEGSAAAYFGLPFSKFSLHISRVRKAFAAREKSWQILVSYQNGMFVNLLLWRGRGCSRVKFLMNPMNKLNKQPRIAGRFFLECYDHTASKYEWNVPPKNETILKLTGIKKINEI